jgi:hypothetical protein
MVLFYTLSSLLLMIKNDSYLASTNSPKLNLCSSLSKAVKPEMDQEFRQCFHASKVHMPLNRISLLDLEWTAWPSNLLILLATMGLLPALGSWVIEKQNDQVKHYVSSSLFHLYSRVFHKFSNKTQSSFCTTLSSLSICGICGSLPRHWKSYAFSSLNICGIFCSRQILVIPSLPHPILVNLCGVHGRWLIHTYNAYVA